MVAFASIIAICLTVGCAFAAPIGSAEISRRSLPVGITSLTAKAYLAKLTVATPSNTPAYNRKFFHIWIKVSGTCDTRETVLKRDGTNVVTNAACSATSGNWVSPYDNVSTKKASDLDIDHVVPLKAAWISGARNWSPAQREQLANDLTRPQLVAVTDNLNQAKGDKDPSTWLPPLDSFKCTYVLAWIEVKSFYNLTVSTAEKNALSTTLDKYC